MKAQISVAAGHLTQLSFSLRLFSLKFISAEKKLSEVWIQFENVIFCHASATVSRSRQGWEGKPEK
jgi:hypothetical protein